MRLKLPFVLRRVLEAAEAEIKRLEGDQDALMRWHEREMTLADKEIRHLRELLHETRRRVDAELRLRSMSDHLINTKLWGNNPTQVVKDDKDA